MAYLITHFFEGGTQEQYEAALELAHPAGGLPEGQTYHAGGPTDGGWLVAAVWDSKEQCDAFIDGTLMPLMMEHDDVFPGPPQERAAEVVKLVTA
jgi:hypothetical protein